MLKFHGVIECEVFICEGKRTRFAVCILKAISRHWIWGYEFVAVDETNSI